MQQPQRTGVAPADPSAGIAHHGVEAVHERDRGDRARRSGGAGQPVALLTSIASGFSQITCFPAASASSASSACRWFGVQMCTTSMSPAVARSAARASCRSAPSRSTAATPLSAVDPATAVTAPPAARTARACTAPAKPVPIMPERSRSLTSTSSTSYRHGHVTGLSHQRRFSVVVAQTYACDIHKSRCYDLT